METTNEDYKMICDELNVIYPKDEIEAFIKKKNRNAIICNEIQNNWGNFLADCLSPVKDNQFELNKTRISMKIEIASVYIDSLVHTACSLYDCILHVINKTLLRFHSNELSDRRVTGEEVSKKLKQYNEITILDKITDFENSNEYKYFHAFDIVSKHRGIIESNFSVSTKVGELVQYGSKILQFDYDGVIYDEIFQDELIRKYSNYFIKLIAIFEETYNRMVSEKNA